MSLMLDAGEQLLRRDAVSFVQGPLRVRPGVCYLTDRRLVAESDPLVAGVLMAFSAIARAVGRKVVQSRRTEIALSDLVRVTQVRYGVNPHVLALSVGGEPVLTMVFNRRQKEAWLRALNEALHRQGRALFPEGEGVWRVGALHRK